MTRHDTLPLHRVVATSQAGVWEAWTTEEGLAPIGIGVTGEFLQIQRPHRLETTSAGESAGQEGRPR